MDEIIAEADDRMLMMDYDEDEGKVFFCLNVHSRGTIVIILIRALFVCLLFEVRLF